MLEIRDVHKTYGRRGKEKKKALNGISLTLTEGVYGLLGPNGAGKSTLMNIITDNLQPDQGEILWNGTAFRGFNGGNTKSGRLGQFRDCA